MVRTALLSTVAAAGLVLPAAKAEAHPPVVFAPQVVTPVYYPQVVTTPTYYAQSPVCHSWTVLYRTCGREPWRAYRTFEDAGRAERVAHRLRHGGYEVNVSVVR
jgi:hypothetical protein